MEFVMRGSILSLAFCIALAGCGFNEEPQSQACEPRETYVNVNISRQGYQPVYVPGPYGPVIQYRYSGPGYIGPGYVPYGPAYPPHHCRCGPGCPHNCR